MLRFTLIIIIVLFNTILLAQVPDIQWIKIFGNDVVIDRGNSVLQTSDGGYIITGYTEDPGGNAGVWLIKTDSLGDTIWTKTFGGNFRAEGNSIDSTSDGGYIITGSRHYFVGDVWLIKTDAKGDTLWSKILGLGRTSIGNSVKQTADEGYIITGTHGNLELIKTDSNGDTVWTKVHGDNLHDEGNSVQQTNDGGYIIAGNANVRYPNGGGNNGNGKFKSNLWLIRTDANGDTLWTKTFGDSCVARGFSVQQTADSGYIITGSIGQSTPPILLPKSIGENDFGGIWLVKTNADGDTLWTKIFGKGGDSGYSVQQTSDGGYVITGTIGLIKTDVNGDSTWILRFEGEGYSIQQTSDGGYIITGIKDGDVLLIKVAPAVTTIEEKPHVSVKEYQLQQNYPNPFNPATNIEYSVGAHRNMPVQVNLSIYNLLGQKVATLVNKVQPAGHYEVRWDASGYPSGVYYYQLKNTGGFMQTRKLLLLK